MKTPPFTTLHGSSFTQSRRQSPQSGPETLKDLQAPCVLSSLSLPLDHSAPATLASPLFLRQPSNFRALCTWCSSTWEVPPSLSHPRSLPPSPPSGLHPNVTSSEKPSLIPLFNAIPTIHPFLLLRSSPQPLSP